MSDDTSEKKRVELTEEQIDAAFEKAAIRGQVVGKYLRGQARSRNRRRWRDRPPRGILVEVVVQVSEPRYAPESVNVRQWHSQNEFIAHIESYRISHLLGDEKVVSVLSRRIEPTIESTIESTIK